MKQARRVEQMAFRITLINDVEKDEGKRRVYYQLNLEAIKGLAKHGGKEKWEKDMLEKIKDEKEAAQNTMLIPMLKRTADKYHDEVQKHRKKAAQDMKKTKAKIHEAKNGGQWAMCKDMGGNSTAPLIALKRQEKGPKGQPKGTVATSPTEIDAIIRKAYGKIYKGNAKDQEKKAEEYMQKYAEYLHKDKQANIEDITGEDLEYTGRTTADLAAGMDQMGTGRPLHAIKESIREACQDAKHDRGRKPVARAARKKTGGFSS